MKRIVSITLIIIMVLTLVTPIDKAKAVSNSNNISYETIVVSKNETAKLTAKSKSDKVVWQVDINGEWIDIYGENSINLYLKYSMAKNVLDEQGNCHVRCIEKDETIISEYYVGFTNFKKSSNIFNPVYTPITDGSIEENPVIKNKQVYEKKQIKTRAANNLGQNELGKKESDPKINENATIIVEYKSETNENVLVSRIINVTKTDVNINDSYTIIFPIIQGYKPYVNCNQNGGKWVGGEQKDSIELPIKNLNNKQNITVIYKPGQSPYTVHKYYQNVYDDDYTEKVINGKGTTGTKLDMINIAGHEEGFYTFWDDEPVILANGETSVDIYYERLYFLMKFDLGGGRGVEPVYAKYGTDISIGKPEKSGYIFECWKNKATGENIKDITSMPANNVEYEAVWIQDETVDVSVKIFVENPNNPGVYDPYNPQQEVIIKRKPNDVVTEDSIFKLVCDWKHTGNNTHKHNRFCYRISDAKENNPDRLSALRKAIPNPQDNDTHEMTKGWDDYWHYFVYHVDRIAERTGWYEYNYDDFIHNRTGHAKCLTHVHNKDCYEYPEGLTGFDYSKYEVDKDKTKDVVVGDNNSTVVNLYYKRKEFTIKFYTPYNWSPRNDVGKIKAPFGKDITNEYKSIVTNLKKYMYNADYPRWTERPWDGNASWTGDFSVMPAENKEYYALEIPNPYERCTVEYKGLKLGGEPNNVNDYENLRVLTVDANPGSYITEEDFLEFTGFERIEEVDAYHKSAKEHDPFNGAVFYYKRLSYNLNFHITNNKSENYVCQFGEPLQSKEISSTLMNSDKYPTGLDGFEIGAKEFVGWYMDAGCTIPVDWNNITMPNNDLEVYAKWKDKEYTVNTYINKESMEKEPNHPYQSVNCAFNQVASGLLHPKNTDMNYLFKGWFYIDENGEKQAFNNLEMPVRRDLNLYAEWTKRVMVNYEVHYVTGKGKNQIEIAPIMKGKAVGNMEKTFYPKFGIQLNEGYKMGYLPEHSCIKRTLNMDPKKTNVIVFKYKKIDHEIGYTVNYIDKKTGKAVIDKKTKEPVASENFSTNEPMVNVDFKAIDGYLPDAYSKKLVLSTTPEENVVNFYYEENTQQAPLHLIIYVQNVEDDGYSIYKDETEKVGEIGTEYEVDKINKEGYIENINKGKPKGIMTKDGLELSRYYDRVVYPYEIKYLDESNQSINIDGNIVSSLKGAAKYGSKIKVQPKNLKGWKCINPEDKVITIQAETNMNIAKKNVHVFIYTPKGVNLTIKKEGCSPLDSNQTFIFKIIGTPGTETANVNVSVVVVGNGQTVISDLPKGKYNIIEENNWSWRYTQSVNLGERTINEDCIVTSRSERSNASWLNGMAYKKNLWS